MPLWIQWEEMPLPLRSSWKDGESSISALTRSPNGTSEAFHVQAREHATPSPP